MGAGRNGFTASLHLVPVGAFRRFVRPIYVCDDAGCHVPMQGRTGAISAVVIVDVEVLDAQQTMVLDPLP